MMINRIHDLNQFQLLISIPNRTPLHCAASCNNLPMVKYLVEHGACIFAVTLSDQETPAQKCEEMEDGYHSCSKYLYSKLEISSWNHMESYGKYSKFHLNESY